MGCACQKQIDNSLYDGRQYFCNLCNIFRNYINYIESSKSVQINAYLIATKSIPNFISLIKKYNFLENDEEIYLEKEESFELEKNIEIMNEYSQCNNLINDDNGKNNEFIIVDKAFIHNIKIKDSDDKFVEISIDHNNNLNEIKFSDSQIVNFNTTKKGFYKFVKFDQTSIKPKSIGNFMGSITSYPITNINININNINESNYTLIQLKKQKLDSNFMNQLCQKGSNTNDIINQINNQ